MKYFAVSDIHGYYDELIEVLKNVGYNSEDDNCKLIVCGDMFDKGKIVYMYINYLEDYMKRNNL